MAHHQGYSGGITRGHGGALLLLRSRIYGQETDGSVKDHEQLSSSINGFNDGHDG